MRMEMKAEDGEQKLRMKMRMMMKAEEGDEG